jgi:photosystem II stability/assembly factor-like uncharacterized protein
LEGTVKKPIIRPHVALAWVCSFILFTLTAQPQVLLQKPANQVKLQEVVDLVNADSISKTIQDLQNFNTRYEYTSGRREAAQYLYSRFQHYSQEVSFDTFQYNAPLFVFGKPDWGFFPHATFYFSGKPSNLWIAGDNGLILRSTDRGESWSSLQLGLPDFLTHIFFIDTLRGWCTGYWGNVYRTKDGGKNWTVIPIGTRDVLDGIVFVDSLRGWVIQNNPTTNTVRILATQDGGLNWAPEIEIPHCALYDLTFTTPDSGFAIGYNFQRINCVVASTFNGGLSWDIKELSRGGLFDMDFIDSEHGWSTGYNGSACIIYRTQDGGKTWLKVYSSSTDMNYTGIDFTDPNHGWASDLWGGGIFQTRDGGKTWQAKKTMDEIVLDVASTDSNVCMAITMNQIHRTGNGGSTWESISPPAFQRSSENVVAVVRGTVYPDSVLIIGAHYDCFSDDPYRYAPGANDNASGVAGIMELARIFGMHNSPFTLEFVAFSAEEHDGLFGSRHYAADAKSSGKNVKAMINLDIIGQLNHSKWYVQIRSDTSFRQLVELASDLAVQYTKAAPYPDIFNMSWDPGSDYYPFFMQGYPVISFAARNPAVGNPPHYHTTTDELSTLTIPYEAEIVKTALATVAALSGMISNGVEDRPVAVVPDRPVLYANFPNPFNPGTLIRYSIPRPSDVVLKIFNLLGREIVTLADGPETAGERSVIWDGKDRGGNPVSSGIYICKLQAGGETLTRRIAVMR